MWDSYLSVIALEKRGLPLVSDFGILITCQKAHECSLIIILMFIFPPIIQYHSLSL